MLGEGDVLGDLIIAGVEAVGRCVLAGIDRALLQRGEHVVVVHGNGHGAEGFERCLVILVLHGADGHALEVGHGLDGLGGEGVAEAGLLKADDVQAERLSLFLDEIAELAVNGSVRLIGVLPEVSLVKDAHLGDEVGQHGVRAGGDIQAVVHRELDRVALAAEGTACENLDLDAAVGRLADELGDLLTALNKGSGLGVDEVHLKRNGVLRVLVGIVRSGGVVLLVAAGNKGKHHHKGKKHCNKLFYNLSPLLFVGWWMALCCCLMYFVNSEYIRQLRSSIVDI